MLGFLPTRAYRPGTPGATTFLSPLSGTFNYGWDSFVEFVASDTASGNIQMAGIIKDRRGKQLPKRAVPPPEYAGLSVGPYRDIVDCPGASNGLAVICASDDLATMVQHALIRYKYRQERASKS